MKHFIPFVFLLFGACKNEYPSIPNDVISMDEMKNILVEMHITDALAETKAQAGMDERALTVGYHAQIFKNHGISHNEFVRSYKFYENQPLLFNKMYDEILSELSRREAVSSKN
jgi:hypothetical protein